MEFDLREWLLILGPVFIAVVLLHGYWRMRNGRNNLKMALDKNFLSQPGGEDDIDDLTMLKAELPNGGARIIKAHDLDVSQDVPVLMEPAERDGVDKNVDGAIEEKSDEALEEELAKANELFAFQSEDLKNLENSLKILNARYYKENMDYQDFKGQVDALKYQVEADNAHPNHGPSYQDEYYAALAQLDKLRLIKEESEIEIKAIELKIKDLKSDVKEKKSELEELFSNKEYRNSMTNKTFEDVATRLGKWISLTLSLIHI